VVQSSGPPCVIEKALHIEVLHEYVSGCKATGRSTRLEKSCEHGPFTILCFYFSNMKTGGPTSLTASSRLARTA